MSALDRVIIACRSRGLEVQANDNGNIYTILNSQKMSIKSARQAIEALNYAPLFSHNRSHRQIVFTVVPYPTAPTFEKKNCSDAAMTEQELRQSVESTHCGEWTPLTIGNESVDLTPIKNFLEQPHTTIASLILEFAYDAPKNGTGIDLGCGVGANSLPLLEKGWKMIAVDIKTEVLAFFLQDAAKIKLENDQLTLINHDIVTYGMPSEKFDLAICYDVLSCVKSKDLIPLTKKIYETLLPGGRFIGSLCVSSPNNLALAQEIHEKLGAHYYPSAIVPALLKHTGFEILDCSFCLDGQDQLGNVRFDAKKPIG